MDKKTYEKDPRSYWEVPEQMDRVIDKATLPPDIKDNPLWALHVLPEIEALDDITGRGLCVDLGCGAGRYIGHASKYFDGVVGVDFSRHSLNYAKQLMKAGNIDNVEFQHASIADMNGITDGVADFAYSCAVFMHMPNDTKRQGLKEVARILGPGAVAILLEVCPMKNGAFDCPDITLDQWRQMVAEAGLTIVSETVAAPFNTYTKFKITK